MSRGEVILASDYSDVIEAEHYMYARAGCRIGGIVFEPTFETTSTSFTAENSNASGGRSLDTWAAVSAPIRANASGNARIEISVYGENVETRLTVKRLDTGATVTTVDVDGAGGPAWASDAASISVSTYAGIPLEFTCAALWTTDGTKASIFQIQIRAITFTAGTDLPTS